MHKLLPLLLLLAMGGVVTYAITRNSANFDYYDSAAGLTTNYYLPTPPIIPAPPTPPPTARVIATTEPRPPSASPAYVIVGTPVRIGLPPFVKPTPGNQRCIPDGRRCSSSMVCCGYCNNRNGQRICESTSEDLCIPKGKFCSTKVGDGKHKNCCTGYCSSIGVLDIGICSSTWGS